jgi:hypothetical protein
VVFGTYGLGTPSCLREGNAPRGKLPRQERWIEICAPYRELGAHGVEQASGSVAQ